MIVWNLDCTVKLDIIVDCEGVIDKGVAKK
jgi:hypothetical protein